MKTIDPVAAGGLAFAVALSLSGQTLAAGSGQAGVTHDIGQGSHLSFTQLDIDGNGVLSAAEAAGTKDLLDFWQQADSNADNVIERSEFAAFEAMEPPPALRPQTMPGSTPVAPAY